MDRDVERQNLRPLFLPSPSPRNVRATVIRALNPRRAKHELRKNVTRRCEFANEIEAGPSSPLPSP